MARQFAKIYVDIADDQDLEQLSVMAQWLYFRVLLTDPDLSLAGTGDWRPRRLVNKARGVTIESILAAAEELDLAKFVYFDDATEEYLVRSKMRHGEVLKSWKCAVSVIRSYRKLASKRLRAAMVTELRRIHELNPDLSCWTDEHTNTDLAGIMSHEGWGIGYELDTNGNRSVDQEINRSVDREINRSVDQYIADQGSAPSASNASVRAAPRKRVADMDYTPEFEDFWTRYPRRVGKRKAFEAWLKATKKVTAEQLAEGADRYTRSRVGKDEQFTVYPTTWLNQERWLDEPESTKPTLTLTDKLAERARIIQESNSSRGDVFEEFKQLG